MLGRVGSPCAKGPLGIAAVYLCQARVRAEFIAVGSGPHFTFGGVLEEDVMLLSLTLTSAVCMAGLDPKETPRAGGASPRPDTQVVSTRRTAVPHADAGHASDFFAALARRDAAAGSICLSSDQSQLAGRLDQLTREVLRAWQIRSADQEPFRSSPESIERFRRGVVAHAEAIVLEAVLTSAQAKHWRGAATQPRIPQLAGRYSLIQESQSDVLPPETLGEFDQVIRGEGNALKPGRGIVASDLFSVALESDSLEKVGLSAPELVLVRQLDEVAREVQSEWLLRCLQKKQPLQNVAPTVWESPPTPGMIERLSERGRRLRASIVAHTEAILLDAVLTHEHAESLKRGLWVRKGVRALMDPELAALLHLSRSQREEIASRLEDRALLFSHEWSSLGHDRMKIAERYNDGQITEAQWKALDKQTEQGFYQQMSGYDRSIWELLRPSQTRELARLLGKPAPSSPAERPTRRVHPI